ncbi:MAG: heme biosynthesis protein HemY, partial [Hyphomicrobiaceae bacterium]|nr:heme biosynthesis protein HemY [Hyphomicrobiaceae bacterium]
MIRVILFLAAILALATGLSWLADQPGNVRIEGQGWVIETSLFRAVVLAALAIGTALVTWSLMRHLWHSPAAVGNVMNRRRNKQGMQALSAGMIAVGSGDRAGATRHALLARKALPNEPMTHLLRAQAAQLAGDKATARRIYEAMLSSPDTETLGLRGLFLEAEREKETEAARQFAERALRLNPKLLWASDALFDIQCRSSDWSGALETLHTARKNGLVEKPVADRKRAVLLAAQAAKAEDTEPDRALNLAIEAHNLAPDLVPAAAQAARMLASRGNTPKAAKIVERAWAKSPHPDLATVYAYARVGDSPRDRLTRIKRLASQNPYSPESAIAVANAAIDAREFEDARDVLKPMLDGQLSQRIATLMARIESEQFGDKGRVREWLARAVNASRDPAWTADGIISDDWSPISPVTGQLDAVQWKVPVEQLAARDGDVLAHRIEELVALGAPPAIEAVRDNAETIEAEPIPSRFAAASTASAARPPQSEPSAVRHQSEQPPVRQPDRADIGTPTAPVK